MGSSLPMKNETFLITAYRFTVHMDMQKELNGGNPEKHPLPIKASNCSLAKMNRKVMIETLRGDAHIVIILYFPFYLNHLCLQALNFI